MWGGGTKSVFRMLVFCKFGSVPVKWVWRQLSLSFCLPSCATLPIIITSTFLVSRLCFRKLGMVSRVPETLLTAPIKCHQRALVEIRRRFLNKASRTIVLIRRLSFRWSDMEIYDRWRPSGKHQQNDIERSTPTLQPRRNCSKLVYHNVPNADRATIHNCHSAIHLTNQLTWMIGQLMDWLTYLRIELLNDCLIK